MFAAWKPTWIQPKYEDNQADMRLVLEFKLQHGEYVATSELSAAVDVMVEKSEVRSFWLRRPCLAFPGL